MDSLGREPQDSSPQMNRQPRSGDRCPGGGRTAAYAAAENLPPLRGFFLYVVLTLGLTPQGKHLSRLRRFVQESRMGRGLLRKTACSGEQAVVSFKLWSCSACQLANQLHRELVVELFIEDQLLGLKQAVLVKLEVMNDILLIAIPVHE